MQARPGDVLSIRAAPSLPDNIFPSTLGTKASGSHWGRKRFQWGRRGAGPVCYTSSSPSFVAWPPFPDSHSPLLQTSHPLLGSGSNLSCPLTPTAHQVLQGRGEHSAKVSLELMRAQLCRCQCRRARVPGPPSPHHSLGAQLPLPTFLGGIRGHTLRGGKGDLEESSQIRVPGCQGEIRCGGVN